MKETIVFPQPEPTTTYPSAKEPLVGQPLEQKEEPQSKTTLLRVNTAGLAVRTNLRAGLGMDLM